MDRSRPDQLLTLTSQEKAQLLEEIKYYFAAERDEDPGKESLC